MTCNEDTHADTAIHHFFFGNPEDVKSCISVHLFYIVIVIHADNKLGSSINLLMGHATSPLSNSATFQWRGKTLLNECVQLSLCRINV